MLSSDFEKDIQQQLGELRFSPDEVVWKNIEAALPEKRRRRFIFFLLVFLLVSGGAYFLWDNHLHGTKMTTSSHEMSTVPANSPGYINATKENDEIVAPVSLPKDENNNSIKSTKNNVETGNAKGNSIPVIKNAIPVNNQQFTSLHSAVDLAVVEPAYQAKPVTQEKETPDNSNAFAAMPLPLVPDKNEISPATIEYEKTSSTDDTGSSATIPLTTELLTGNKLIPEKNMAKLSAATVTDSAATAIIIKQKPVSKWVYGIHISAGTSNIKGNLFGDKAAADPVTSGNSSGGYSTSGANNGSKSLAMAAGIFAELQIGKQWKLHTGLQWDYFSNSMPVGEKVDSVLYPYIGNSPLQANYFYRNNNTSTYLNQYHYLQLPLIMKYTLPKLPLYVEAGPSISWLMQSNALQYNGSRNAYFTNAEVFNKWLLTLNGGFGFDIAKSRRTIFSIGYNFSFSTTSTTRADFGKQHLLSSLLYVNIPFKK